MVRVLEDVARNWRYPVPAELRRRHVVPSDTDMKALRASIQTHYHRGWRAKERYSEEWYQQDLDDHVWRRLEKDRRIVVPWLNALRRLCGLRVLEVGCGTGSSTVALAEQGAIVTGIDIDADSLAVARDRCRLYKQQVDLCDANVIATSTLFKAESFDLIIIFACLEHMTFKERIDGLPILWKLLAQDGMLAVIETPNRLWFFDWHTSLMPFFNWLPDELAFHYSRFSNLEYFKDDFREPSADKMLAFSRLGRGASFHEFDVALGTHEVLSSLSSFHGYRHTLRRTWRERRFKALIKSIRPDLHDGWFEPWLDLVIQKR
jgi:S-adenosylmethionine-dependent methyltransferase